MLSIKPHLPVCFPFPTGACCVLPTPATLLDRAVDTLCPPCIYMYIPVDLLVSMVRSLDVAAAAGRQSNTSDGWGRWVVVGAWSSLYFITFAISNSDTLDVANNHLHITSKLVYNY